MTGTYLDHTPAKWSKAKEDLPEPLQNTVETAKKLYKEKLAYFVQSHKPPAYIVTAPGRVNLIGEHTDYTEGFVLPLAIDQSTVIYGTGFLHTGRGAAPTMVRLRMVSDKGLSDVVEERRMSGVYRPPDADEPRTWVNYVVGVVANYMPDLPAEGCVLDLAMAIASDVPLGAGLSSSASLEVAVATFVECYLHEDMAYSSAEPKVNDKDDAKKEKALRCQRGENEWAHSPCGIMDQLATSAATENNLMLIDCRSLEITSVPMKQAPDQPVLVICNSKVEHEIADSEYGLRRHQCQDALEAIQNVPLYHVLALRDATLADVQKAEPKMEAVAFHRAKHVCTENQRVKECKIALKTGLWDRVGELMNASHNSLRDDFEVSCDELNCLVEAAQAVDGVYGSRMTGGGFGGCTVTLCQKDKVEALEAAMKAAYAEKFEGKECECFVTHPASGARVLAIDMDTSAESDFFKK